MFLAIIEEYVKHLTVRFIDDKRIKELVKEYVETGNKDLLGETYTLIKKVAQAVTCKYYRVRDPEELEEILLSGPSNYGIADPAHGTTLSLLQITSALFWRDI